MRAPGDRVSKRSRHERIVARLANDVAVRISALADEFQVTTETIRRDLDELSARGLISRTYGGAAPRSLTGEPGVMLRAQAHVAERQRIAAAAAKLVRPGDVVMIDAGSTTAFFAAELARSSHPLTAITNSLGVARALGTSEAITVLVCPGELRSTEDAVFGPETLAFLDRYHADAVFFGAGGFAAAQVTDADAAGVWVKRKMLERSERAFLLADHSKAGQRQFAVVCATGDLDELVTGKPLEPALDAAFAAAQVTVHVAPDLTVGAAA
jgi:DeoR/GlpR family transcriptional regulator of sugar metabolism